MDLLIDGTVFRQQRFGGISRIYSEIIPRIRAASPGLDVRVAVQGPKVLSQTIDLAGLRLDIPSVPATLKPWRFWHRAKPSVDRAFRRAAFSLARTGVFHPSYYSRGPAAVPSFCFVYDMIIARYPREFDPSLVASLSRRMSAAVKAATVVLCISEATRRDVVELLRADERKCRVVPLAPFTPVDGGAEPAGAEPKQPFLLFVGNYQLPYKNFDFVVECLGSEAFAAFNDFQLVVVSSFRPEDGHLRRYRSAMPGDRLHFVHDCTDAQLRGLYQRCAAFLYPSRHEGFGIPVLEALQEGAPVVSSNASSLPEVGGSAVHYFDPMSAADFRAAVEAALREGRSDDAVRRRREHAASFSWARVADEFLRAYGDCLA